MGDISVDTQCAKTGVSVSSIHVKVKVGWAQQMIYNSTTQKAGQRIPQVSWLVRLNYTAKLRVQVRDPTSMNNMENK